MAPNPRSQIRLLLNYGISLIERRPKRQPQPPFMDRRIAEALRSWRDFRIAFLGQISAVLITRRGLWVLVSGLWSMICGHCISFPEMHLPEIETKKTTLCWRLDVSTRIENFLIASLFSANRVEVLCPQTRPKYWSSKSCAIRWDEFKALTQDCGDGWEGGGGWKTPLADPITIE